MSEGKASQETVRSWTDRRRILAAIRGEAPDRIPFVPRLEFWYRARRRSGTLPPELRDRSLAEIADALGVGFYSNVPDFTDSQGNDMLDQALGIIRLPVLPYRVTLKGVERRIRRREHETTVEYRTPKGTFGTTSVLTEEMLHHRGKFLMTHTDGENRLLLPLYLEAAFDIADSLCPYPMTRCRLEEIRAAFRDRITIWGGIPSVLLCAGSASVEEFRHFIDDLLSRFGHESHFVLGVSDMVTADAEWDRLQYLAEGVARLA